MIPVKLQLKNFMSYRQAETLDFTGFDLAILNGDNGVGKSTLLEAITWALWGRTRAALDDNLIHQGETAMWVEFIFDYEENRYRVVRTREARGRGSSSLEFQIAEKSDNPGHVLEQASLTGEFAKSWKPLTGPTIKQTQETIVGTLKLDYDLFINSSYLRQGHADEFTTKIPAQRKEILASILDLSLYDRLEEKAKEKRRELEGQEQLIGTQIIDLEERLASKPGVQQELATMMQKRSELEEELKKKETALKKFEDDRRKYELVKREIELLRRRFEEIASELKEMSKQQEEEQEIIEQSKKILAKKEEIEKEHVLLRKFRKEYEEGNEKFQKISAITQELRVIEHREQELQATIERLRHVTVCPTCLRVMSKKEAETIIAKLTKQFEQEVGPERKRIEMAIDKVGFNLTSHEKIRARLSELSDIEDTKRQLDVAEATLEKSKKLFAANAQKITRFIKDRMRIETEGKKLKAELMKLTGKQRQWEQLEGDINDKRDQVGNLRDTIGGLKDRLNQIASFEKQIDAKTEELKKLTEEISLYNDLILSFGKKGVQAMIIEQTIPQVEEGANFLLQKITGGRMQVKFLTQRAKKSDESEIIETLDIEIRDELGSRPYEQYSGGESFRINFAIRVALAKLLAIRAGAKLRFLVIDEGFGTLDSSGREDIVAAISAIRQDFAKVMIVTHIEEFKNLFPTRIEVTKDSAGSHVQVFAQ